MKGIVLHPLTERQLADFVSQPSHALLLMGPAGSGKRSLAVRLAEELLGLQPTSFASYAYGRVIEPEKTATIGIEVIRELEHFLSLKVPTNAAFNRIIIISAGHLMTLEAQNALLKTLEEPPAGTIIIMTAETSEQLLPTIRSRMQTIQVLIPPQPALQAHFSDDATAADFKRAYAISGGLPGLMQALLHDEDHPLLAATATARQLLSQSSFERLRFVDELAKQRPRALEVTFILQQMAQTSLQTAQGAAAIKWQTILAASYQAREALSNNAQPKLALTNLMLHL